LNRMLRHCHFQPPLRTHIVHRTYSALHSNLSKHSLAGHYRRLTVRRTMSHFAPIAIRLLFS
jgi:hypothetical protein